MKRGSYLSVFGLLLINNLCGQQFSLPDILGASYCSGLVGSKSGSHIAWVVNMRGIRSIYTAQRPDFMPQLRYQAPYDDGQEVGNFQFDKDETQLYFVKGSAPNRDGQIANPSSESIYPSQQLFRVDLGNGHTDTLGPYPNYLISPTSEEMLIVSGPKIEQLDLKSKSKTVILEMRGRVSDVSYSPDGSTIVFVSQRGDHSFVGYYVLGTNHIHWVSPSIYHDQNPVWSESGNQIAFIRAPGDRNGALRDITGGNPFSIMIHNLSTDESIEAWSSPADDGGFAQYYHDEPLRWFGDQQLLFYSEHEGWMKIYAFNLEKKEVINLLPGDCEIEHSHLSTRKGAVVFSTNCGDIDRRDLYLYDLQNGRCSQITDGDFIETDPLLVGPAMYVYRKGGVNLPTSIALVSGGKERAIYPVFEQPDFPSEAHVVPRQVVFQAADGTQIHGQLFAKDTLTQQPGLLFMHGGPIRQMLLGYHYSSYYANAYAFNQYLANQGYVVLSVNYRAGIGYGKSFRRAENQGPRGASEYQDIVAAGKFLQKQSFVDQDRIGLWGGSYGGLLTAQGLAQNSDIFKAGVDFHGVHDWSWRARDFSKGGWWGISEELMERAYESSPVADMSNWTSPVLLIHGDDDRNVMFGQTIDLAARLKELNVYHEILVLPDEVHGFYRYKSWLKSYEASADFLNRFLKK
jgi:dipeptidyl aminopeptidase/acylaminoacyl peptidase